MSDLSAKTVLAVACVQLLLLAPRPATAQTNVETNAPGIQLNFSTPGARSLALGGTFLGRADDATAAYANPAGLANLPAREASLEVRGWTYTHLFTDSGRSLGEPTGRGIDTVAGLIDGEASNDVQGISFASFVYPAQRWAIAVYFHTLADFEAQFSTRGAFVDEGFQARLRPVLSESRLKILTQGASAAFRLTSNVSLGLGLSRYEFDIDSTLRRFDVSPPWAEDPGPLNNIQTQKGKDSDVGATLGLLWRLSPRWQVGTVYRQGPSFAFEVRNDRLDPAAADTRKQASFNVPDQWGVGVMFQATDRLIVGFDYYRIGYSAFAKDFTVLIDQELLRPEDFTSADGNEYHAGLEYAFLNGTRPWFLRTGLWYDPPHGITYEGDSKEFAAIFRPRDGYIHWAAGGGVIGNDYQLDVGVDYSERAVTFSLSAVVRF